MTDITTENRTTKRISEDITKRKRNDRAYAIYAAVPWAVNQTWQSTRKRRNATGSWFELTMNL